MELNAVLAAGAAVVRVDTGSVEAAAQRARGVNLLLRDAASAVARAVPGGWSGAGHEASERTVVELGSRLNTLAGALEAVGLALSALAVTLRTVQGEYAAARRVLASAGPLEVRVSVASQLQAADTGFADADRRAAEVVCDALLVSLAPRTGGVSLVAPLRSRALIFVRDVAVAPPIPKAPPAVAVWWAGLTVDARTALTTAWPFSVGALDGIPARVRDGVNRRRLAYALQDAQRGYAQARRQDFGHQLTADISRVLPWPLSRLTRAFTGGLAKAAARVNALGGLTQMLQEPGSELLDFDPAGDGRAVVASGDVESSRSIAVLVPAMLTELRDVPELAEDGGRLADAAGSGTVAVAWLGYDAPGQLPVVRDARAKSGAVALRRFTAGLRSTGRTLQHVTVVGHSYGSLVAGIAARGGLPADDLVLLASPGVEVSRASQLGLPPRSCVGGACADRPDPGRLLARAGRPAGSAAGSSKSSGPIRRGMPSGLAISTPAVPTDTAATSQPGAGRWTVSARIVSSRPVLP